MTDLKGKVVYVIQLDQPYVNYYAEVSEDNGDLLVVHDYDEDGDVNLESHIISRKQIEEIVE
jgi:hypothetical protein